MTNSAKNRAEAQTCLTLAEFTALGRNECAYVKQYLVSGQVAFVLHAADGSAISVQRSAEKARDAAQEHDLELISLH